MKMMNYIMVVDEVDKLYIVAVDKNDELYIMVADESNIC